MKAAVYYGPGEVQVEEVGEPGPPGPEEVLLRVQMGALCGTDASQWKAATMVPLAAPHPASGHQGPVILGHEVVGRIIAIGAGVLDLTVGQRVVPGMGAWCGECPQCRAGRYNICEKYCLLGIHAHGGLAELLKVPARMCVPVPDACVDAAAAMAQPTAVALHALRRAGITAGQTVALYGVGGIGSLLLAALHAAHPDILALAVDIDPQRLETARRLGATCLIDASVRDAAAAIQELTHGRGADVAIEATGVPESISQALASVGRGGRLLQVGIPQRPATLSLEEAVVQEKEVLFSNGQVTLIDLPRAVALLAETDFAARVGYRVIPLEAVVEEGLRPLAEHRATAKVVVQVAALPSGQFV